MYDAYGKYLRPGYCKNHPEIKEEYPCDECRYEIFRKLDQILEEEEDEEEERLASEIELREKAKILQWPS